MTGAPLSVETHRTNGVFLGADNHHPYIDQAHAVAMCLEAAVENDVNEDITASAVRAIGTLLWLASYGAAYVDNMRKNR